MSDRLIDLSLRAFGDVLASDKPVPGGGSAAAYAGTLGAALCAMVARVSAKKSEGPYADYIAQADNLRAEFLRLVDDDGAVFARVSKAMKLPKSTDAEKAARQEQLQGALLAASRVPLEVAKAARRLLDLCEQGLPLASPTIVSDIGVGALMAENALRSAALNVMINLASLKDAGQVKSLSEDLDRAMDGSEAQRRRVLEFVESRIAR